MEHRDPSADRSWSTSNSTKALFVPVTLLGTPCHLQPPGHRIGQPQGREFRAMTGMPRVPGGAVVERRQYLEASVVVTLQGVSAGIKGRGQGCRSPRYTLQCTAWSIDSAAVKSPALQPGCLGLASASHLALTCGDLARDINAVSSCIYKMGTMTGVSLAQAPLLSGASMRPFQPSQPYPSTGCQPDHGTSKSVLAKCHSQACACRPCSLELFLELPPGIP